MDVGPDEILVTTGGQQVIDLVCKTLIDPGDVIVAEGPTYPGAVPTFCAYEADVVQIEMDADGMRIDLLEETLDRLEREGRTPKFIYTVPTFQNPAGVTMALDRRRRLVAARRRARAARARGQPVRAAALRGRPAAAALRARRRRVRDLPRDVLEDPRRPACGSAGPRRRARCCEKLNLGKQGADLCSSTFGQHFVVEYFAQRDWRDLLVHAARLYRRRRDAMLDALAEHLPPEAEWTRPARRPVHLGDAAGLHRHDRPAGARAARARRVRARARGLPGRPRRLPRCG